MADIPASTWSETDASNSSASPEGAPEGMAPSGVNNTIRMIMGGVKRWFDWTIPKTTAGTTTAYTLSYTVAPAALVDGMSHLVQFNATCGASPTLNVNSLGAKPIHKFSAGAWGVCAASDIPANGVARVSYNSGDGTYRITSAGFTIGVALLAVANTFSALLTMSGAAINEAKGADIASATTTDIGAATGNYVTVTGTTTITGLGTVQAGTERTVYFSGALTLTYNATSLILPGSQNILTAAGDTAVFRSEGSGNWRCIAYTRRLTGGGQFAYSETGAVATGSTNMPLDDTIPQNTEGDEYITLAITPQSATSTLVIEFMGYFSSNNVATMGAALFQDSTANALAAVFITPVGASTATAVPLKHVMTSGTTSSTTFKIRVGSLNTLTFNGVSGSRYFGGKLASSLTIREILP